MVKKRLDIRIAEELRDGVDLVAQRNGQNLTTVVERYVRDGLARDNGMLVEESSLPEIRAAVQEEVGKTMAELYQKLSDDLKSHLKETARRSDNRLAALIVKAARSAGIGQRMIYALVSKSIGQDFAARA